MARRAGGKRDSVTGSAEEAARLRRADSHARGLVPAPASEGRSRNQRAIKRTNTKPEIQLRSQLHALGLRFRKDYRVDLPDGSRVRPDVVFTRLKIAVFYDSCFWHACPHHGRVPSVNDWYWAPKLARTAQRDAVANTSLRQYGWLVVRIWEHDDLPTAAEHIAQLVQTRRAELTSSARVPQG